MFHTFYLCIQLFQFLIDLAFYFAFELFLSPWPLKDLFVCMQNFCLTVLTFRVNFVTFDSLILARSFSQFTTVIN